jgi:predicted nuclease of restriction endonuclease-like (RecB) superfamily
MAKKNVPIISIEKLYSKIKQVIEEGKNTAYRAANFAMVKTYWHIGQLIVEEEQNGKHKAAYGEALLEELATRLTKEYGKSFSSRNLRYIRQFYRVFPKWNALRSELSWTHYRLIIKLERADAKQFYMQETIDCNWGTRTLERQINSLYFERMIMTKSKEAKALVKEEAEEQKVEMRAEDIIKDPYMLNFLNLNPNAKFYEQELEQAIIDKLQDFLLELGKGFCFVARQYRLSAGTGKHFYADLVFYNYILKCFLVIDLKAGELTHQDIGQMDMYVRYFEDQVKQANDNPTIGLILCTEKNKTVVKYSLLADSKQIFASKYKTFLPTEKQLKEEIERERKLVEMEKKLNK